MSNVLERVAEIATRYDELTQLLADPAVAADFGRLNEVDRERSDRGVGPGLPALRGGRAAIAESRALMEEGDEELRALAELEVEALVAEETALDQQMMALLLPKDRYDDKNVIMEIRAGTGGEEAGLFAAELFRMYSRWAEGHRYKTNSSA